MPKEETRKQIRMTIDDRVLADYDLYYFGIHKQAKKRPIPHPYHESINQWMIMKRPMMNALKKRWKDFIVWFIHRQGYANLRIEKCEMVFTTYFGTCESGFLIDDDSKHLYRLTLSCGVDRERPRTQIDVYYTEKEEDTCYGE